MTVYFDHTLSICKRYTFDKACRVYKHVNEEARYCVHIVLNIILHDCVQFDSVHMKDVCFVAHINLDSPQAKLILCMWVCRS